MLKDKAGHIGELLHIVECRYCGRVHFYCIALDSGWIVGPTEKANGDAPYPAICSDCAACIGTDGAPIGYSNALLQARGC